MDIESQKILKKALKYQEALTSYAFGMLHDWSLAEDAVQDAIVVLVEKISDYDPEKGLYSWVKKMVYYKSLELIRANNKEVNANDETLLELVGQSLDLYFTEDEALNHKLKLRALEGCIKKLAIHAREAVMMFYYSNESCEKIAEKTNKSVNAIWLLLSRVRKALKICIEKALSGKA